ncbi:hypothetical protein C8Q74DRAFT_520412 [Fomes fomentarius]|nr:hypothetical protein C8Q74DRAFT_520412 [Fomes fomentarius]
MTDYFIRFVNHINPNGSHTGVWQWPRYVTVCAREIIPRYNFRLRALGRHGCRFCVEPSLPVLELCCDCSLS